MQARRRKSKRNSGWEAPGTTSRIRSEIAAELVKEARGAVGKKDSTELGVSTSAIAKILRRSGTSSL